MSLFVCRRHNVGVFCERNSSHSFSLIDFKNFHGLKMDIIVKFSSSLFSTCELRHFLPSQIQ